MVRELKHTEIGDIPVDWELQTFDETFRVISNNTLSRENLNNRGGAVRNIHYGDILTKFPEVLDCSEDEIPFVNDLSLLSSSTQLLQDGDIVVADTAEDETVGKVIEVQNLGDSKLVAGLHTIPCRVKKGDFAPGWLGYYMNSDLFHNQILPYITGIKVSSISKGAISETLILVPPFDEQEKIVQSLNKIQLLMTAETKVVNKIKLVKNGCLSKMFPQKDDTVPEMRLPGFTEAWEQRKVSELAEKTYGGGTPTTSNEAYWNGDIPWIQSSDVVDGKLFGVEPRKRISRNGLNNSATQLVPENSIAIITRVGVGKLAFMPYSYATSQDFLSLSKLNTEPFFTVYACYKKLQSELNAVQGTSIKGITKDELLAKIIMVPQYAEQQQIGAFFSQLDNLITLHQCKCDKYSNIKKGMMSDLLTGKIRLV